MGKPLLSTVFASNKIGLVPLQAEILSAIAYFDVFSYPLKISEIAESVRLASDPAELKKCLNELVNHGIVSSIEDFYFLKDSQASDIERRKEGNRRAAEVFPKALRSAKRISRFPFVEGVCVSGSLSKNYFDKDADVDFFIITKPGRLWLCRTLLIAFKKIFLFNSKKYFCVNYFVDSDHLYIPDHNIFTATEISHLRPVYNFSSCKTFAESNSWTKEFLPFRSFREEEGCHPENKHFVKNVLQGIFSGKLGERMDNYFFKLTLKRWKKKFHYFNPGDFDLNLRSRKTVSKHHPNGFQQRVLVAYEGRLKKVEEMLGSL